MENKDLKKGSWLPVAETDVASAVRVIPSPGYAGLQP